MTYIYALAAIATIGIFRAAARRLARYSLFVLTVPILGCGDGPDIQADGGMGGGGTGGEAGTTSPDAGDAAPAACFVNSDCPSSLTPSSTCQRLECDPTGRTTANGSPVLGCYILSIPIGSACDIDGGAGRCENNNGLEQCSIVP